MHFEQCDIARDNGVRTIEARRGAVFGDAREYAHRLSHCIVLGRINMGLTGLTTLGRCSSEYRRGSVQDRDASVAG